ncbi:hypothetical protein Hanom_Chr03g00181651 [Helianthus anomalus]
MITTSIETPCDRQKVASLHLGSMKIFWFVLVFRVMGGFLKYVWGFWHGKW